MRAFILIFHLLCCRVGFSASANRVLIFGKTIRPAHADIIPLAGRALTESLIEVKIQADVISDPAQFEAVPLSDYRAIILLDVSEKVLSETSKHHIEQFVESGGGLVALHASISAGRDWPWIQKLFGVEFVDHPPVQEGRITITDSNHIFESMNPKSWNQIDEWYNFSGPVEPESAILMRVERSSPNTPFKKVSIPNAWKRQAGRGNIIYIRLATQLRFFKILKTRI